MAAALMNMLCGSFFEAESAGLEPRTLNSVVIQALNEIGIDISSNLTRSFSMSAN